MKLMDKAKQAALAAAVKTGLGYLEKDPEVNIPKLMEHPLSPDIHTVQMRSHGLQMPTLFPLSDGRKQ